MKKLFTIEGWTPSAKAFMVDIKDRPEPLIIMRSSFENWIDNTERRNDAILGGLLDWDVYYWNDERVEQDLYEYIVLKHYGNNGMDLGEAFEKLKASMDIQPN